MGPAEGEWEIRLPPALPLLTLNQRAHWSVRSRLTRDIRTATCLLARQAHIPEMDRAHVTAALHPHDRRRRDPHNWTLSFKAMIDGIVDAGVLPDDCSGHLLSVTLILGEPVRGGQLSLTIRRADDA